jgi:hypothetical protein
MHREVMYCFWTIAMDNDFWFEMPPPEEASRLLKEAWAMVRDGRWGERKRGAMMTTGPGAIL